MNSSASNSANATRNRDNNFGYAHFSEVDRIDLERFPDLANARPYRCVIQAGESLFIPRGWWHWVKTLEKCAAVNYWIESTAASVARPELLRLWNGDSGVVANVTRLLRGFSKEVWVWNSRENTETLRPFQDFYQSRADDRCVITLDGYAKDLPDAKNQDLRRAVGEVLPVPPELRDVARSRVNLNVWLTAGKHDTGLHYDDADGWLCVLEGSKEVLLFGPEDSSFLYPLPVGPDWANSSADRIKYNTFEYLCPVEGWSSSRLLYESLKVYANFKSVFRAIDRYRQLFGPNRLVWGFKNLNGDCRWELYYYHYSIHDRFQTDKSLAGSLNPQLDPSWVAAPSTIIHSLDLFNREICEGPDLHVYQMAARSPVHTLQLPFLGDEFTVSEGVKGATHPFAYDTQRSFLENYPAHQKDLGFALDFRHLVSLYQCQDICVFNKGEVLLVLFIAIDFDGLLRFVARNNYKPAFIQHLHDHRSRYERLRHEVGIGFDATTLLPLRSAIYGIL